MSFLSPTPSVPQSEPENGIGSAAKAFAEIERQLSERGAAPDIKPVLTAIAGTAHQLMRQPRVATDAEIQHVLRLMALTEDMERFDALAEVLRSRLANVPLDQPARPRPPADRLRLRL